MKILSRLEALQWGFPSMENKIEELEMLKKMFCRTQKLSKTHHHPLQQCASQVPALAADAHGVFQHSPVPSYEHLAENVRLSLLRCACSDKMQFESEMLVEVPATIKQAYLQFNRNCEQIY